MSFFLEDFDLPKTRPDYLFLSFQDVIRRENAINELSPYLIRYNLHKQKVLYNKQCFVPTSKKISKKLSKKSEESFVNVFNEIHWLDYSIEADGQR